MLPASLQLELGHDGCNPTGAVYRGTVKDQWVPAWPLHFPVGASFTTGDRVGADEDQRDWSSEPDADFTGTGSWGCEGS